VKNKGRSISLNCIVTPGQNETPAYKCTLQRISRWTRNFCGLV